MRRKEKKRRKRKPKVKRRRKKGLRTPPRPQPLRLLPPKPRGMLSPRKMALRLKARRKSELLFPCVLFISAWLRASTAIRLRRLYVTPNSPFGETGLLG